MREDIWGGGMAVVRICCRCKRVLAWVELSAVAM